MGSKVLLVLIISAICLAEARQLRQSTYINIKGHQPAGVWSRTGEDSEAGASSREQGVRYNAGKITMAGDGAPGPLTSTVASSRENWGESHSGNTMAESDTNLGHAVIAATTEGARAVAGSGVSDTAEDPYINSPGSRSGNSASFRPSHINNKGSHAFTDNAGTSAATVGQGNGPVVMAFGHQIGAFSRSHRDHVPGGGPADGRD